MIEEFQSRSGILGHEKCGFTFELTENPRENNTFKLNEEYLNYSDNYLTVGKWRVLPYGLNDDLPKIIKNAVQQNAGAPGQFEKKTMTTWGNGPYLYTESIEDNQIVKKLVNDEDIMAWLRKWKYEEYLWKCAVDYDYMKGCFSKVYRNKGFRLGHPGFVSKLEHIMLNDARLACRIDAPDLTPTHIAITNWEFNKLDDITNMKVYPLFDAYDPFVAPTMATYSNQYTFGDRNYSTPPIFGTLEWLRQSTATPIIFKHFSRNSMNIKFHVESPQEFWDAEEKRIQDNCKQRDVPYEYQMLVEYRKEFMRELLSVLTDIENTGKVWHTRKILEVKGNNILEHGWKITPIDQKIKDFVSALISISERADRVISTSLGFHGSLGNVTKNNTADSGSEQLNAYQNFINSSVDVPERIICRAINDAIRINFPKKNVKIGFHQTKALRQSEVSPDNRQPN